MASVAGVNIFTVRVTALEYTETAGAQVNDV
jgi:hypothetical protein